MSFSPMLAHSAPANDDTIARLDGTHYFELKIDGIRCVMIVRDGVVRLQNRNGVDVSARYPDLCAAALLKFGPKARVILDGEIAVTDDRGLPSFNLTSKRDRQSNPASIAHLARTMPVTYFAFDVLYQGSDDVRSRPWGIRHSMLMDWMERGDKAVIKPTFGSMKGETMLGLVRDYSLEGLVAKRVDSTYQSGRRSSWIKIKPTHTGSFLVTGTMPGRGTRHATFGSLCLAVIQDDGTLLSVGEVGSGFRQADLLAVMDRLKDSADLIVEVEFLEYTEGGSLRFPVFRGIRTDLTRADADHSQLGVSCDESMSSSVTSSTDTLTPGSTSPTTTGVAS